MTATHPSSRLLLALLTLGQEAESIDLFSVSEEAGLTLFGALRGLSELAERGLVRASRMRLTMSGLSMACSLAAGEDCVVGAELSVQLSPVQQPFFSGGVSNGVAHCVSYRVSNDVSSAA